MWCVAERRRRGERDSQVRQSRRLLVVAGHAASRHRRHATPLPADPRTHQAGHRRRPQPPQRSRYEKPDAASLLLGCRVANARECPQKRRRRRPWGYGAYGGDCPRRETRHRAPACEELDPPYDTKLVFVQKVTFVLRKSTKTAATRAALFDSNMHQIICRLGLRPRPHLGSFTAPPRPPSRS